MGTGLPLRVMVTAPLMGSTDTPTGESSVVSSSSRSRNSAISDLVTSWSGEKVVAVVPGINPRKAAALIAFRAAALWSAMSSKPCPGGSSTSSIPARAAALVMKNAICRLVTLRSGAKRPPFPAPRVIS